MYNSDKQDAGYILCIRRPAGGDSMQASWKAGRLEESGGSPGGKVVRGREGLNL